MGHAGIYRSRVDRVLASAHVVETKPAREAAWPIAYGEPPDLAAFYQVCDGLILDDGVRVFGKGELHDVTRWLVLEKGLAWADDLVVIGERRDVVLVLDLDQQGVRAGGGVLEAGSDDLEAFERVASSVLGYLLARTGANEASQEPAPPEVAARRAADDGDALALERELLRPMYPGQARLFVALSLQLGALWAQAGETERALAAFGRSVEARLAAVGRGAEVAERRAAWQGAAFASRAVGCASVAAICEERAGSAG